MPESDPLSQMFNLLAAPIAGTVQSVEQFRNGVDQFQRSVENFNRTMENLNETAERINRLLEEVEEPLRASVPQVTRTIKAADEMMKVVSGPAIAVAPGLQVLADTLNNPAMRQMPDQIAQMNAVMAEVTARLAPLTQLAESAGGLFGGLKIPGFGGSTRSESAPEAVEVADDDVDATASTATSSRAATSKKSPGRKSTAKKSAAKKTSSAKRR